MPGGRRIIYIKNPKSGSHFRNIGGSGGGGGTKGPKPPKPPTTPGTPSSEIPPENQYGGAGSQVPIGGWSQPDYPELQPGQNPYAGLDFGTLPGYGIGPYQAPTFEQFVPSETLWGMIYDIATGVDPYTGDYQPAYGAPGTLQFDPLNMGPEFAGRALRFPGQYHFGGRPANAGKRPWFLNTNRNDLGIFKSPFRRKK